MAELREQTALLKASNDSLEAQLDQVTGSLEDMMARNEGAQRMCRVRDQVIEELELMLVRKVEDGELVEAELAALRGVAEECLRCMEAGHSPPPPAVLHRMRTALAGQLAEVCPPSSCSWCTGHGRGPAASEQVHAAAGAWGWRGRHRQLRRSQLGSSIAGVACFW